MLRWRLWSVAAKLDPGEVARALRSIADKVEAGEIRMTNFSLSNGLKQVKPVKVNGELWEQWAATGRRMLILTLQWREAPGDQPNGGPGDVAVPEPEGSGAGG